MQQKNVENTSQVKPEVKLTKGDLIKHWFLGYSSETCYNYERLQALGTANAMIPIIKRLYKTKEERAKAMQKYMVFFNTEPSYIGTVIHGISASMEEQAANGVAITDEERALLKKFLTNGITVSIQIIPAEKVVEIEKLL